MSCGSATRTPTTRVLRWPGSPCPRPEPGAPSLGATETTEPAGCATSTTPHARGTRRRADVGSLPPARARTAGLAVLAMGRPWLGHGQVARYARRASTGAPAYPAPAPCAVGSWTGAHRGSWSTWYRGRTGAAITYPTKACRTARAATGRADRWRPGSPMPPANVNGWSPSVLVAYVASETEQGRDESNEACTGTGCPEFVAPRRLVTRVLGRHDSLRAAAPPFPSPSCVHGCTSRNNDLGHDE